MTCSYIVQLESGLVTSRHRRFLKCDSPINVDIVAEGEEPHARDIPEASGVADQAQPDLPPRQGHGLQTRSKHRKANHRANHVAVKPLSLGNFPC